MQFEIIKLNRTVAVSQKWLEFWDFVQKHPFATFDKLRFENGDPVWGEMEVKVKESVKF